MLYEFQLLFGHLFLLILHLLLQHRHRFGHHFDCGIVLWRSGRLYDYRRSAIAFFQHKLEQLIVERIVALVDIHKNYHENANY